MQLLIFELDEGWVKPGNEQGEFGPCVERDHCCWEFNYFVVPSKEQVSVTCCSISLLMTILHIYQNKFIVWYLICCDIPGQTDISCNTTNYYYLLHLLHSILLAFYITTNGECTLHAYSFLPYPLSLTFCTPSSYGYLKMLVNVFFMVITFLHFMQHTPPSTSCSTPSTLYSSLIPIPQVLP
jgi:hypothetical protein